MAEAPFDPREHIGESVTFRGTALTAAAGAIVTGVGRPVYIGGLRRWETQLEGKPVEVSGVLRGREGDLPAGAHGVASASFVLDDARWSAAD